MTETRKSSHRAANAVCDVLRYFGDVSYAVLPPDVAHQLGDLKKSLWSSVQSLIDKEIDWIDARVAGGDRLREEWKRTCTQDSAGKTAEPVN